MQNNNVCDGPYCKQVDIRLSDLEPNKSYDLSITTHPSSTYAGGPWTVNGSTEMRITADADGNYSSSGNGYNFLYGYPDNKFEVYVNGKSAGVHSYG